MRKPARFSILFFNSFINFANFVFVFKPHVMNTEVVCGKSHLRVYPKPGRQNRVVDNSERAVNIGFFKFGDKFY